MTDAKPLTLREKRRLETRELLISAASSLMGEQGFQSTSIEEITARAGTSRATFYAYFDSKDAVLAAVHDRMWREVEEIYARFGALEDWSPAQVGSWLTEFAAEWRATADRNRAAVDASHAQLELNQGTRYGDLVALVRTRAELWSHFTEAEADSRATMLVLMLQEVWRQHFMQSSERESDLLVEHLTGAVRDLLRAG